MSILCNEKNFGLFRRLGIAPSTTVNKSTGLFSLNFCLFIRCEGSVPTPRAAMPWVSPTLAAPTLCPVYHGIVIFYFLHNPKGHPDHPFYHVALVTCRVYLTRFGIEPSAPQTTKVGNPHTFGNVVCPSITAVGTSYLDNAGQALNFVSFHPSTIL